MQMLCILNPIAYGQNLYILDNDKMIQCIQCSTDEVTNTIASLIDKYHINEVQMSGSQPYIEGIRQQVMHAIQQYQYTNLNPQEITINFIKLKDETTRRINNQDE